MKLVLMILVLALAAPAVSGATQTPQQNGPSASAPAFVRLDGEFKSATGEARSGSVVVVISLYGRQDDTAPLWTETQAVTLDAAGRYTVFAGATQAEGLPRELFAVNAAQWIGVALQGEPEQPRVRMVSVPYALSAGNADTLGGVPVTDFVMTDNLAASVKKALTGTEATAAMVGDPTIMGTASRIPKFTGVGDAVIDSVIWDVGGNIGIGSATPANQLVVANGGAAGIELVPASGALLAYNRATSAYSPFVFNSSTITFGIAGAPKMFVDANGRVGVGTTTPTNALSVAGSMNVGDNFSYQWGDPSTAVSGNAATDTIALTTSNSERLRVSASGNVGIGTTNPANSLVVSNSGAAGIEFNPVNGAVLAYNRSTSTYAPFVFNGSSIIFGISGSPELFVASNGFLGVGTTSPTSRLHVAGDVIVTGNIGAKYQDVAEWVETGEPLEVGTVVIVAASAIDQVVPSQRAYDTRVAGAVSRQPGLILGERGDSKSLIAQSGRVRIKVDATYGAIKAGDLLVTSPTPGHAMLSKPMKVGKQLLHRPGTLVGKALEGLPNGRGEILVLLTLQ